MRRCLRTSDSIGQTLVGTACGFPPSPNSLYSLADFPPPSHYVPKAGRVFSVSASLPLMSGAQVDSFRQAIHCK